LNVISARLPFPHRVACALCLALVFAFAIYRGVTQSLTCDEAFTQNVFLRDTARHFTTSYDANNHILYSLLARASTSVLGSSEWAIRLPALAGAALYLIGVYRFVTLFSSVRLWLLTVLLLCIHPYLLDFLSAARGYGLALAFFLNAATDVFEQLLTNNPDFPAGFRPRSGILLGLSVGANLTFLFPSAALLLAAFISLLISYRPSPLCAIQTYVDKLVGRFVVVSALIVMLPLSRATRDQFYYGARDWKQSYESFLDVSVRHGGWLDRLPAGVLAAYDLMPFMFAALFILSTVIWIARFQSDTLLRTSGMAFFLCICLYQAAHTLSGTPYPLDRTGFGLLLLLIIMVVVAFENSIASTSPVHRGLGDCLVALSIISAVFFLTQLETSYFFAWKSDAATKRIVQRLNASPQGRTLRIGGSYASGHTVNYYRERLRLAWLAPMSTLAQVTPGMDYYLLSEEDHHYIQDFNLRVIYYDALSGTALCRPR
jgi:hypothetical protein